MRIAWLTSTGFLLAAAVLGALPDRDWGIAHVLGDIVGRAVVAILVAVLVRTLYLKLRGRPRRLWTPALLFAAAGIAVLAAAGATAARQDEHDRSVADFRAKIGRECGGTAPVLASLPPSLRYVRAPSEVSRRLEAALGELGRVAPRLRAVADAHHGKRVGVVIVATVPPSQARRVLGGFRRAAEEQGARVRERGTATHRELVTEVAGGTLLASLSGCRLDEVGAVDEDSARRLLALVRP